MKQITEKQLSRLNKFRSREILENLNQPNSLYRGTLEYLKNGTDLTRHEFYLYSMEYSGKTTLCLAEVEITLENRYFREIDKMGIKVLRGYLGYDKKDFEEILADVRHVINGRSLEEAKDPTKKNIYCFTKN